MINKEVQICAVAENGITTQSIVAMEECAELIQAISKLQRDPDDIGYHKNLAEEIADVLICIEQLKQMYNVSDDEINRWTDYKQTRLLGTLNTDACIENGKLKLY